MAFATSASLKAFLGIDFKLGRRLTDIAQDPKDLLAMLESCAAGAGAEGSGAPREVHMVLITYPYTKSGGRYKQPFQLQCTADVVLPLQQADLDSHPSATTIRLRVQSTCCLRKHSNTTGTRCVPPAAKIGKHHESNRASL